MTIRFHKWIVNIYLDSKIIPWIRPNSYTYCEDRYNTAGIYFDLHVRFLAKPSSFKAYMKRGTNSFSCSHLTDGIQIIWVLIDSPRAAHGCRVMSLISWLDKIKGVVSCFLFLPDHRNSSHRIPVAGAFYVFVWRMFVVYFKMTT